MKILKAIREAVRGEKVVSPDVQMVGKDEIPNFLFGWVPAAEKATVQS